MPDLFTENISKAMALPKNSNLINYSVLKEFFSPSPFRSFSIKYVVEGNELYSVNGSKYYIKNKQYLLANRFSEGFVEIDSKQEVTGICIDLAPDVLSEVIAHYLSPDAPITDLSLDTFFNTPHFLENKYHAQQTLVGQFLLRLENELLAQPENGQLYNKEFYFALSEKIIADHIPLIKQLHTIKAIKAETKKDLLRRVLKGKEFIDEQFLTGLSVEQIARHIALSEYHFLRLFKSVYSISPHQYIIQKRLQFAKDKMRKDGVSLTAISVMAGFSDVHSFSKSFKKQFGFAPSKFAL